MLAPFLDRLSDEELDAVPYGIIQLDAEGHILSYNKAEADGTNFTSPRPIGRDYFGDVAPSAFVAEIFGRYVEAYSSHHLDEMFRFTFIDGMMPRTVLVRMYYSARTGTIWIFTANPDGSPFVYGQHTPCDVRDAPSARVA
jgi:photoactive yellow protein